MLELQPLYPNILVQRNLDPNRSKANLDWRSIDLDHHLWERHNPTRPLKIHEEDYENSPKGQKKAHRKAKKKKLTNREESGSRLSNPFAFIFRVVRSSLLILANVNSRLKSIGLGVIFKNILTREW